MSVAENITKTLNVLAVQVLIRAAVLLLINSVNNDLNKCIFWHEIIRVQVCKSVSVSRVPFKPPSYIACILNIRTKT